MPTPKGLPKVGEIWTRTFKLPGEQEHITMFRVRSRGGGEYWSMHVDVLFYDGKVVLKNRCNVSWVDAAWFHSTGQLEYVPTDPRQIEREWMAARVVAIAEGAQS